MRSREWLTPIIAGAIIGAVILGLLGRAAMRIIAHDIGQTLVWTVGGSVTVVALGLATGAGFGLVFAIAQRFSRGNKWARTSVFGAICLFVTLRGLRPVTPLSAALFIPLVMLFGALLHFASDYLIRRTAPTQPAQPA